MQRTPFVRAAALAALALFAAAPARAGFLTLDFNSAAPGTIRDANGNGTGLTARLPNTGGSLAASDPNLTLNTTAGTLGIRSTRSDLNGQQGLGTGEYLGTRLSTLGFTGAEDFVVNTLLRNVAYPGSGDQFGLYVGSNSTSAVRGGALNGSFQVLFTVGTDGPNDTGINFTGGLAPLAGDNLNLTLRRTNGVYSLAVQNLTTPARSGTLTFTPTAAASVAGENDLYVGLFAANATNNTPFNLTVDSFAVNVVTTPAPPGLLVLAAGAAGLARRRRPAAVA